MIYFLLLINVKDKLKANQLLLPILLLKIIDRKNVFIFILILNIKLFKKNINQLSIY